MPHGPLGGVLRHIRRWAGASSADESTDAHLLQRFAQQRDESAFDALMRRHGPLVFGVCRRVLGDVHDAEDAFQATFLVLARRAAALDQRGTIAGWLHTVAYHIAVRAKSDAARRRQRERQAAMMTETQANDDLSWRDLRPLLDEELHRLPEKYRSPLLLCYLEGKTQEETAALLGWSKGTVSGRLARAREMLRIRLTRRGVTLSAALATSLAHEATAAVPAALHQTAHEAALRFAAEPAMSGIAAELARAALRATGIVKGKALAALLLAATVFAAGTGILLNHRDAATSAPVPAVPRERAVERHVDVYGDPLPPGALLRLGTVRLSQAAGVRSAVFSPNGKMLASSGHYGYHPEVLRLWDVASGKEIRHFPGVASHLTFAPDNSLLAASDEGGALTLWDTSTGKQAWLWNVNEPPPIPPQSHLKIGGVAFAPNGKSIAVAVNDGTIRLREKITNKERLRWKGQASDMAFAPDGKTLASFDFMGKTVVLWDPLRGAKRQTLTHPENVASLAFSPDSRKLVVRLSGNDVFLWDALKGKESRRINAPGIGYHIGFSPDGNSVSTGDWSFDLVSNKETRRENLSRSGVALSADVRLLATDLYGTLHIWDAATEKEVVTLHRHYGPLAFVLPSADGKTIRTVGQLDQSIRVWDAATGKPLRRISTPPWQHCLARSADGTVLAAPRWDDKPVLIDPASGEVVWESGEPREHIAAMALTADGARLAVLSGDKDKTLRLWDTAKNKKSRKLSGTVDNCSALAFTLDGKTLAAAVSLDQIRLWDVATGKVREKPNWTPKRRKFPFEESIVPVQPGFSSVGIDPQAKPNPSPAAALLFSPKGETLAVMSGFHRERWAMFDGPDSGLIRLYEAATGKERFQLGEQEPVAVFSPDGKLLASGGHRDHAVYLWDAATGQQRARFAGHRGAITALAFSRDGRTLISGSFDGTALMWDVAHNGK